MGFAGNLRTLSLAEVLQTLNRIQATGVLRLASEDGGRDVIFAKGEIIGVSERPGTERQTLVRRLIHDGAISAEDAARVTSTGRESQVVKTLTERGLIELNTLTSARVRQASDELYNLCTWDAADFVFHDAGPDTPEITAEVDRAMREPVPIQIGMMLIEAARRVDDWERMKQVISDDDLVLGVAEGKDGDLGAAAKDYPGSAVVPLLDGVRTVGDLVRDSVATRYDVYAVLSKLFENGTITELSRDDLIYHGDWLATSGNDPDRAAQVYRRALAMNPADASVMGKLANCLEALGDNPKAAHSYAQLALSLLAEGHATKATPYARRAIKLQPGDPHLHLSLVRCLLGESLTDDAILELKKLVAHYIDLGQFADARGTCLKILELDAEDEQARRELARIYSQAERDPTSEDVVVCVSCGEVNHREAATCQQCKAALHLTCLSCARVVGVSDRVCIFCGADPHHLHGKRPAARRFPGGSPSTSRIVGTAQKKDPTQVNVAIAEAAARDPSGAHAQLTEEGGSKTRSLQRFRNQLEAHITKAKDAEVAGDWYAALEHWKEVAKIQPDSPELQAHLREVEARIHDLLVENEIERGHQLRRVRRHWAAARAYRHAYRLLPEGDPRLERLSAIIRATSRQQQKIGALYAAGFIFILVASYLVAKPYLDLRELRRSATALGERIEATPDAVTLLSFRDDLTAFDTRARALTASRLAKSQRPAAEDLITDLSARFQFALGKAKEQLLTRVENALTREDASSAQNALAAYLKVFPEDASVPRIAVHLGSRVAALVDRDRTKAQLQAEAPTRLAAATAHEQAGELGAALALYRTLHVSPDAGVAAKAKEGLARVEAKERSFLDRFAAIAPDADLAAAATVLDALRDEARSWGRASEWTTQRERITQRQTAAASAYAAIATSSDLAVLDAFATAHPGSREATDAKARATALRSAATNRADAIARHRALVQARDYAGAHALSRELLRLHGAGILADAPLPLAIESVPPGATVTLAGTALGRTPLVHLCKTEPAGDLDFSLAGWAPLRRPLAEAAAQARFSAALVRETRWQLNLEKITGPALLVPGAAGEPERILITSGEALCLLDGKGGVAWRTAFSVGNLNDGRAFIHLPTLLRDGRFALGAPDEGLVILDARGGISEKHRTSERVRGRPLLYVNEAFGLQPRISFAAEALFTAELGKNPQLIAKLSAPALAGPIAVPKGIDQVLCLADVNGRLIGIEESTKTTAWTFDLKANDVTPFITLAGQPGASGQPGITAPGEVLCILDAARLVRLQLTAGGAAVRWTQPLVEAPVGDPAIADGTVHLAAGRQIVRLAIDGAPQPALPLPGIATAPVAARGPLLAAGCGDTLVLYRGAQLAWSTTCPARITSTAITADAILAGLADGRVLAFAP